MLSAEHRNQANSHPQCSERKTRLLLLHVGTAMERVLFIGSITCLYSDWISRFNSMLVHQCLAAGWELGCELWLFQKKDEVWSSLSVSARSRSCSLEEPRWQVVEFKPIFWHPLKTFVLCWTLPRTFFGSDVAGFARSSSFETSWFMSIHSPRIHTILQTDENPETASSPASELFMCQPWSNRTLFLLW